MILGIVVEGPTDEAAYSALIPKIRGDIEKVVARPCGGRSPLAQTFVVLLKEFQSLSVDKAIVIRDSDRHDPKLVENKLEERLRESGFQPSYPVHFYATYSMLDTWLLADEGAVNRVAQRRGKNPGARPVPDPLEGDRNAKALFRRMLSQARLPADPAVYREVADAVDLDWIGRRCPYFRQFVQRIHAC